MRVIVAGFTSLGAAVLAGLVAWAGLAAGLPQAAGRATGPALTTVTAAQLAALGLGLERAQEPPELPEWMSSLHVRLTRTMTRSEAEQSARSSPGPSAAVWESVLAYATLNSGSMRWAPAVNHRLSWVVVGARTFGRAGAGFTQRVLWLIDARSGARIIQLALPRAGLPAGPVPGLGPAATGQA